MQTSVAPAAFSPHVPGTLDQVRVLETMGLIVVDVARLGSAQLVLGNFSHFFSVITYTFLPPDFSCRQFDRTSEMALAARQEDSVAPGPAESFAYLSKEGRPPSRIPSLLHQVLQVFLTEIVPSLLFKAWLLLRQAGVIFSPSLLIPNFLFQFLVSINDELRLIYDAHQALDRQ